MFIGTELEEYQELARKLSLKEFIEQCEGSYLLGNISKDSPNGKLDFYTGVIHLGTDLGTKAATKNPSRESIKPGAFLSRVVKKPGSVWSSWFSVGRANNNDIVIRHPTISKLHARLYTQGTIGDPAEGSRGLWIGDMGSTKGTFLNGKPLEASVRYPLQLEDCITLGEVELCLLDAVLIYRQLSST